MNLGVVKSDKKNVTEAMENYSDALTDLSGETDSSAIASRCQSALTLYPFSQDYPETQLIWTPKRGAQPILFGTVLAPASVGSRCLTYPWVCFAILGAFFSAGVGSWVT